MEYSPDASLFLAIGANPPSQPLTLEPSNTPTKAPFMDPPTISPLVLPSTSPSKTPSNAPTRAPFTDPPTTSPSVLPTTSPSNIPSNAPTLAPTVKKQCEIDVELFCTTKQRSDCKEISPPSLCPDYIEMMTLRYTGIGCDGNESSIECNDFKAVEEKAKVLLLCVDGNGNALDVEPDGFFAWNHQVTISNSVQGEISEGINCALFESNGPKLQSIVISAKGISDIVHGQTIGAFQLLACSEDVSCIEEFQYEIAIYNNARDSAVLSDVTLVGMDGSKALLQEMSERVIQPNDSLTGIYFANIDLCSPEPLQMGLFVEVSFFC